MDIKIWYYYDPRSFMEGMEIDVSTYERSKEYCPHLILLKTEDVIIPDVEIPSRAFVTKAMVSALKEQNQEIQAEAQAKIQANKNKIQSLLCIENKDA